MIHLKEFLPVIIFIGLLGIYSVYEPVDIISYGYETFYLTFLDKKILKNINLRIHILFHYRKT